MGAWGSGSFDNDTALDWLEELDESSEIRTTLETLAQASPDCYLDADSCCSALAAAEVIAACGGLPSQNAPSKVTVWGEANPEVFNTEMVALVNNALQRIESSSELQELFDEGGRNEEWHSAVRELSGRLTRAVPRADPLETMVNPGNSS